MQKKIAERKEKGAFEGIVKGARLIYEEFFSVCSGSPTKFEEPLKWWLIYNKIVDETGRNKFRRKIMRQVTLPVNWRLISELGIRISNWGICDWQRYSRNNIQNLEQLLS